MKRIVPKSEVKTLFIISILIIFPTVIHAEQFDDVDEHNKFYDDIQWMADNGIKGYKNGDFGVWDDVMRGQSAVFFSKVLHLNVIDKEKVTNYFNDVDSNSYHSQYIATVGKEKIFTGDKKGNFGSADTLTREQMASAIVRAFDLEGKNDHVDINLDNVSVEHQENVQIMADHEITDQLDDFRPSETIERGQFSAMLYRASEAGFQVKYETQAYNYDFSELIEKQMNLNTLPKTDTHFEWYDASEQLTAYYANPNNFERESDAFYQFLKLDNSTDVPTEQLNEQFLNGMGELDGSADKFKHASDKHNINEVYLVSHALHETGNGTSELASGIKVGKDEDGKLKLVIPSNENDLTKIKTVYNFFGIGAQDDAPIRKGAKKAYKKGWTSPEKAIEGGAKFAAKKYISKGQDTLYKMRWNPDNPGTHQYATDVGWSVKQTANIKDIYNQIRGTDGVVMTFEIPEYDNQPSASQKPTGIDIFHVDTGAEEVGEVKKVKEDGLRVRKGPTTGFDVLDRLPKGDKVTITGKNSNWYRITIDKQEGWVSGKYLKKKGSDMKERMLDALDSHISGTR